MTLKPNHQPPHHRRGHEHKHIGTSYTSPTITPRSPPFSLSCFTTLPYPNIMTRMNALVLPAGPYSWSITDAAQNATVQDQLRTSFLKPQLKAET